MIAVIDYKAGNTGSIRNALRRFGQEYIFTDDAVTIQAADKVILPGVGEAGTAMLRLQERGLAALLPTLTHIAAFRRPFVKDGTFRQDSPQLFSACFVGGYR